MKFKGIICALAACLIWGLLCVIPQFMQDFNSLEICMGRYFFFGLISTSIFIQGRLRGKLKFSIAIWKKVFFFSLLCTFGYYLFFVFGIKHTSATLGTLIIGLSPITMAFYGNWKEQEGNFKKLLLPSFLMLVGLLFTNSPLLKTKFESPYYFFGLLSCFTSLFTWVWYMVANAQFLKRNPEVSASNWSTLIGLGGLWWTFVFGSIYLLSGYDFEIQKYSFFNPVFQRFLIGASILGVVCSWLGGFLWNRASFYLSISLAAQLTIFDTIFGLLFVYIAKGSFPSLLEGLGVILFLIAITCAIRVIAQSKKAAVINKKTENLENP